MSHLDYTIKTVREWNRFRQYYDALWQTIENGAVRITHVTGSLTAGTYYFGLDVPAGRRFILYNRSLRLTEGLFFVDVVVPASGFTGGTLMTKSRLNPDSPETVQTNAYAGVTPSGALTLADQDFVDVGTDPGTARVGGAAALDDVVAVIRGQSCLRITSDNGGASYRLGLRLIAWEEEYSP